MYEFGENHNRKLLLVPITASPVLASFNLSLQTVVSADASSSDLYRGGVNAETDSWRVPTSGSVTH